MKKLIVILLLAACSKDDISPSEKVGLILGKWKQLSVVVSDNNSTYTYDPTTSDCKGTGIPSQFYQSVIAFDLDFTSREAGQVIPKCGNYPIPFRWFLDGDVLFLYTNQVTSYTYRFRLNKVSQKELTLIFEDLQYLPVYHFEK